MIDWLQVNQALANCAQSGISRPEAIRRLAIEQEAAGTSWERVGTLYYVGLVAGECDAKFYRSMAISALECLQTDVSSRKTVHLAAHADAEWAVGQLLIRESPATGDSLYLQASIIYWSVICGISLRTTSENSSLHDAVSAYRHALDVDPTHWLARYFLICCLFDLKDWPAVLHETNTLIESQTYPEHQQWRRSKLEEWQIVCLFNLNQSEQAQRLLASFLEQFILEPPRNLEGKIESLDELAECLRHQEIDPSLNGRFSDLKSALEAAGVI